MSPFTFQTCTSPKDIEPLVDLLLSTREALRLPNRAAAEKVVAYCFAHGKMMGVYYGEQLVGALGFFYGEPAADFANKEILFLYVATIRPDFQQSRIFLDALLFILHKGQREGCDAFRLQAAADNPYTCKLYGRFAQRLREEKSPRGIAAVTFGATIDAGLARLARYQRRSKSLQPCPTA